MPKPVRTDHAHSSCCPSCPHDRHRMHGRFRRRGLGRRAGRPAETARRPGPQSQDHHRPARRDTPYPARLREEQRQGLVQSFAYRPAQHLGLCFSGVSGASLTATFGPLPEPAAQVLAQHFDWLVRSRADKAEATARKRNDPSSRTCLKPSALACGGMVRRCGPTGA